MSADDQGITGGMVNRNVLEIDFRERQISLEESKEVLSRVEQYTKPTATVQRVCDHPVQIIAVQKQIMDLQAQQFPSQECDHSAFQQQLEALKQELEEARSTPRMVGADEDLCQELDDLTRDARQSGN